MPKIPIDRFKYYYVLKYLSKPNETPDKGYFLGLDVGSSVFGAAEVHLPETSASVLKAKDSSLY